MRLFSIIFSAVASLGMTVAANPQGFFASCSPDWYMQGNLMIAECRRMDGSYMWSQQDMNLCIGHVDGQLVSMDTGNFALDNCQSCMQGTAHRTEEMRGTSSMVCLCGPDMEIVEIDLGNIVSNEDGYLWCHGHRSAPLPGGGAPFITTALPR